jgi:sugar O-acyltransferase (sialic acid O-acetyltransferase NeuD family)
MESCSQKIKSMVFWGASGQARVLRECMKESGIRLVALFDNDEHTTSPFGDVPLYHGVSGFESWMRNRSGDGPTGCLVAIGGEKGKDRLEIQQYLEGQGLIPLVAKHPTAFVADNVRIGVGSQILAKAAVCVQTIMGRGCIINTGAIVDHECCIGDGVHIGPGAHLAGGVKVEKYSTIHTGATVLPKKIIGQGSVVGAGAVVIEDVPSYTIVVGNPAKIIKSSL